jgi:hypothetical protein
MAGHCRCHDTRDRAAACRVDGEELVAGDLAMSSADLAGAAGDGRLLLLPAA